MLQDLIKIELDINNECSECGIKCRSPIKSKLTSILSTIIHGVHELADIVEWIKEEAEGSVIIDEAKITMNCMLETKRVVICFHLENLIASFIGFPKIKCIQV